MAYELTEPKQTDDFTKGMMGMMMAVVMGGVMLNMFGSTSTAVGGGTINWDWLLQNASFEVMEPYSGDSTEKWNTGTATSGDSGGDLVTIGSPAESTKIYGLTITIGDFAPGAGITIRMYELVNGTEQQFYSQTFTVGTDPDAIPVIDGPFVTNDVIRVELYSDNPLDDDISVDYEYTIGRMQTT